MLAGLETVVKFYLVICIPHLSNVGVSVQTMRKNFEDNYHFTGALGHWFCCTCVCFPFVICLKNVRICYKTAMKEEKLEKFDGKLLVDIFGGNAIFNIYEKKKWGLYFHFAPLCVDIFFLHSCHSCIALK